MRAEALGIVGVEAVAGSDANDRGSDYARVGFESTSDRCDGFSIVRSLTCQGGWMVDRSIFFFDFVPHEFTRRERRGWGRLEKRHRKAEVPMASLGEVRAIPGFGIEVMERKRGERGCVYSITYT